MRSPGYRCSLFGRSFLKIFDRVRDGSETVYSAQSVVDTFIAQTIANRGTRFDRLESDAVSSQFIRHAGKRVSALQVNARRSGKIEHNQLRWRRFSVHALQDRLADMVHVEVHET